MPTDVTLRIHTTIVHVGFHAVDAQGNVLYDAAREHVAHYSELKQSAKVTFETQAREDCAGELLNVTRVEVLP